SFWAPATAGPRIASPAYGRVCAGRPQDTPSGMSNVLLETARNSVSSYGNRRKTPAVEVLSEGGEYGRSKLQAHVATLTRPATRPNLIAMDIESDDSARLKLLLADIRHAFAKTGGAEISSADLVKELIAIEGRPWAERGKNGKRGKPLTQFKLAH